VPTLAQIEQDVAARCGPFEEQVARSGTPTTVVSDALGSTIPLGGLTDRWLLRRGAPTPDNRQRRVAGYAPAPGTLTVDLAYDTPIVPGELIELLVLDPAQELRPAVLRGLARCYFVERAAVEVTPGQVAECLSAALFWVTDVGQVRDVQSRVGTGHATPLRWYRLLSASGPTRDAVGRLRVDAETTPPGAGVYVVEALRPHATWVNGADAPDGPTADADVLACPLDYAAALGHAEAWRRCRATLAPISRAGYADGLEAVSREVTRLVRGQWWYWDRPDRVRVGDPGGAAAVASPTWRTVEEDYTWRGLEARTWRDVMERA
jgi:hypothetical protein